MALLIREPHATGPYPCPMEAIEIDAPEAHQPSCDRSPFGTFAECPHCAGEMMPEHAHYRCTECGWRDSCCD